MIIVGTHIDLVAGGLSQCKSTWLPIVRRRYHMDARTVVDQEEHGFPHIVDVKFVCCAGYGQNIDDLCNCIYETACNIPANKGEQSHIVSDLCLGTTFISLCI